MSLPSRPFYSLTEAGARWNCSPADIVAWSTSGLIELVASVQPVCVGEETLAGIVEVCAEDILPMFRRDGTGPSALPLTRLRRRGQLSWRFVSEPQECAVLAAADIMLPGDEVRRWEDQYDLLPRTRACLSSTRYDWDEFYVAVIKRVHEQGLPNTQTEFVQEFIDWFVRRSEDGDAPDERTVRRRITPIWRALREA
ncbi:MAG: hypothetical protein ACP5DC_09960 [Halothiobacillaceae bacterium]